MSAVIPKALISRLRYLRKLHAEWRRKNKKQSTSTSKTSDTPLKKSTWATPTNRKGIERMIKLLKQKD